MWQIASSHEQMIFISINYSSLTAQNKYLCHLIIRVKNMSHNLYLKCCSAITITVQRSRQRCFMISWLPDARCRHTVGPLHEQVFKRASCCSGVRCCAWRCHGTESSLVLPELLLLITRRLICLAAFYLPHKCCATDLQLQRGMNDVYALYLMARNSRTYSLNWTHFHSDYRFKNNCNAVHCSSLLS